MENDVAVLAALSAGKPALVWRREIADTETPVSAALKLMEEGRGDFLLESVEGGATRGRYSLLGLAPDLVFRAEGNHAEMNRVWETDRAAFTPLDGGALEELRALSSCYAIQVSRTKFWGRRWSRRLRSAKCGPIPFWL